MFKKIFAAMALVIGMFTASAALACESDCTGWGSSSGWGISGMVGAGGFGGAQFAGDDGFALAEKSGYAGLDIAVNGAGEPCGLDCTDFNFSSHGYVGEHIQTAAGALSHTPGTTTMVMNEMQAFGKIVFQFQNLAAD